MSAWTSPFVVLPSGLLGLAVFQQGPVVPTGVQIIPGVSGETQANIFLSVVAIVLVFLARRAILAVVNRRVADTALRYRWVKGTANASFVVAAIWLWTIWFAALSSLGTFLGLLSAGLAIALKDLVADLAGWAFIVWRRPFDVGDRIQIGDNAGDVVDRRIFQFTIMEIGNWVEADQSTGRLIHIPNARLFTEPLANYIAGFPYLWNELKVLITFESDWRMAKRLLDGLANEFTVDVTREAQEAGSEERFMIRPGKRTPVVYTEVKDSGVQLTLRYLCRPRQRRGTAGELWERILDAFAECPDVALAYPTQRINLSRELLAEHAEEVSAGASRGRPE